MAPMRTVEFRSSKFPAEPADEQEINPGRWGRRLASYLSVRLAEAGWTVRPPYAEDWGMEIPIVDGRVAIYLGCGNYMEFDDGFLCFLSSSLWSRLRHPTATRESLKRVEAALDQVLTSDPEIHAVRWWTAEENSRG